MPTYTKSVTKAGHKLTIYCVVKKEFKVNYSIQNLNEKRDFKLVLIYQSENYLFNYRNLF
jgi:hypothetical protein